jgi:hypothetical protein
MVILLIESLGAAIIGWFVLALLSTNLLGLLVRGMFRDPEIDRLINEGHQSVKQEASKSRRADTFLNIAAVALIVVYLYLLGRFSNVFFVIVAMTLMATRLPDLLWEIKHGRKLNVNEMPKNWFFYLTTSLDWCSLPGLWYAFYLLWH